MSLRAGIVGLPNVGKSTLFNALTAAGVEAANYPFATIEPNVGVVSVPDDRLDQIRSVITTERMVPATVEIVDIAGLVRGASEGEGLGNQFLSHIRSVDAIVEVLRCFEDPEVVHVEGDVDPLRDIETVETELALADLEMAEKRLERAERAARSGDKAAISRRDALRRLVSGLGAGRELSGWWKAEGGGVPDLELLTTKPVLYVCNVDEAGLAGNRHTAAVEEWARRRGAETITICAELESEIALLPPGERPAFLAGLGLEESGLHRLARATYRLLGLRTFFTVGPKEVRAWTIPAGSTAWAAAGVIHSDFQKGFIRAEVYRVDDLLELGSEQGLRAAGKVRLEGRDYVLEDGDVIYFRFNV